MNNQEPLAYLKGEFVPVSSCVLPIYDLGIVLGAAVTDLVRTFHGEPYRIEDHIDRLYRSCRYARITPPVSKQDSMDITHRLVEANLPLADGADLAVVYYMTAGEYPIYAGSAAPSEGLTLSYVQHTFPLPPGMWRHLFIDGAHCVTPSVRHWPPASLSSKIKHRNRLHMWIGDQEAHLADPQAISLYLDVNGNIAETGGSNFVVYTGDRVVTPRRSNILWGISLTVLGEILKEMDIPLCEDDIQVYDAVNAEEAWIPTTPYCLAPVTKINGAQIGDGKPGPMWRKILDRWSEIAHKDVYLEVTEGVHRRVD